MTPFSATRLASAILFTATTIGCGPSQADLDAALDRAQKAEQSLADARSDSERQEQKLGELAAKNDELLKRLRELQEKDAAVQARLQAFREMLSRFKALTDSGKLRVRIVRNRMVVELPEGVLFDSGQAELKPEGQAMLAEVAAVLKELEKREYQIAGHTDNVPIRGRGGIRNNWDLSTRRAVNVTGFLLSQGLPPSRLSASGHADSQPVASNDTPEGRAQNRRIEIVLLPNLDELPDLSSLEAETR